MAELDASVEVRPPIKVGDQVECVSASRAALPAPRAGRLRCRRP